ncbi:uncharacterized protein LOC108100109 isoform X2 [Drosophila ficusphila]|uniref:uncharacterized protein LOC108100109 isoform X2 n=1 Tax=Drosophila ficusphila TaxID=30025 RepID=UPI0007E7A4F4|nr:uncharacterized protein LOC108100109 isoform X2 [Drosophila ficusphila]
MHHPPGQKPLHAARRQSSGRKRTSRLPKNESCCNPTSRTHHLPALLIILLVLIQNFELHMCRQLMRNPGDKRSLDKPFTIGGSAAGEVAGNPADGKRTEGRSAGPSQPEEIFSAPADEGYDEYPMVVPKRAALLLDRLMVALHHALEQERSEQRIGDFFGDKNALNGKLGEYHNGLEPHQVREDGMYSDDDPGTMLDYDFKDLNQINRATGETRRAGVDRSGTSQLSGSNSGSGSATGPRRIQPSGSGSGGGRAYWRCYFNAVSCF